MTTMHDSMEQTPHVFTQKSCADTSSNLLSPGARQFQETGADGGIQKSLVNKVIRDNAASL